MILLVPFGMIFWWYGEDCFEKKEEITEKIKQSRPRINSIMNVSIGEAINQRLFTKKSVGSEKELKTEVLYYLKIGNKIIK